MPGPRLTEATMKTIGAPPGITLPGKARGKGPPSWAGKVYRKGVVTVANPYGAEAGTTPL